MLILPIKELRDTNKISKLCNESDEPIYITKNGYGDMVVMSAKTYEETVKRIRMYEELLIGIKEADSGKVVKNQRVLKDLKEKYGL